MKRKLLTFAIMIFAAFGATANAQDTFYPGFQWGVKGGVGYTVGETSNIGKLISRLSRYLVGAEAISVCLKVILLASQTDYNGISIISIGTGCTPIRDTCTL